MLNIKKCHPERGEAPGDDSKLGNVILSAVRRQPNGVEGPHACWQYRRPFRIFYPALAAFPSVHNPLLPLFRSKRKMLRVHRLDLHRNADHATPRRTKHIPPSLIFHIIQKIFLLIHFELQLVFLQ